MKEEVKVNAVEEKKEISGHVFQRELKRLGFEQKTRKLSGVYWVLVNSELGVEVHACCCHPSKGYCNGRILRRATIEKLERFLKEFGNR